MGVPYEKEFLLGTTAGAEIIEISYPDRVQITKIVVLGPASFNLDVYNRAFTSDTEDIVAITDDGNTKCSIFFLADIRGKMKVNDEITVAANSVGGYNTQHIVTSISDDGRTVVTDQAYSADGTGGTGQLDIQSTEQPLYKVMDTVAASGGVAEYFDAHGVPFVNLDPEPPKRQGMHLRKLYLGVSAAGTYRATVNSTSAFDN
jgi:hypothetical protein